MATTTRTATPRMLENYRITREALASNSCPSCGAGVHRNLSLSGWVQCDRSGAPGFRRDTTGAACSWQGFTGE